MVSASVSGRPAVSSKGSAEVAKSSDGFATFRSLAAPQLETDGRPQRNVAKLQQTVKLTAQFFEQNCCLFILQIQNGLKVFLPGNLPGNNFTLLLLLVLVVKLFLGLQDHAIHCHAFPLLGGKVSTKIIQNPNHRRLVFGPCLGQNLQLAAK